MPKPATLDQARAAKDEAKRRLAGKGEVVGVGVTRTKGGYAVRINLKEPRTAGLSEFLCVKRG
jgi:hypothetical protein